MTGPKMGSRSKEVMLGLCSLKMITYPVEGFAPLVFLTPLGLLKERDRIPLV